MIPAATTTPPPTAAAPVPAGDDPLLPRRIMIAMHASADLSDKEVALWVWRRLAGAASDRITDTLAVNVATLTPAQDREFRATFFPAPDAPQPAARAAEEGVSTSARHPAEPAKDPASTSTMTQAEISRAQGFTGDSCPSCGSWKMVRTGTCVTCQACSHNQGCG